MRPASGRGNFFQTVIGARTGRSVFDMSHEVHTTCNYGLLYPVTVQEALPGDVMTIGVDALIRQQPTISPVMGKITATYHLFFVPKRIVWHNYERYITRGNDGMTIVPHISWPKYQAMTSSSKSGIGHYGLRNINPNNRLLELYLGYIPKMSPLDVGSLWDHLGLPLRASYGAYTYNITDTRLGSNQDVISPGSDDVIVDDSLRRAYCLIWNDYYRDENLADPIRNINGSGLDELEVFDKFEEACVWPIADEHNGTTYLHQFAVMWLLPRAWKKDYFTSALPWQQRGVSPAIPLSGNASANFPNQLFQFSAPGASWASVQFSRQATGLKPEEGGRIQVADTATTAALQTALNNNTIDLSGVGTISMNDWYVAFGTQKWMEYQAKGGSRLIETLQAQWGVSPSDGRLQRPEYIGGCKIPVIVSEVVQTAPQTQANGSHLGTMAGHGMAVNGNYIGKYRAEEYGWFIGLLSFETSTGYQQGFPREMTRSAALEEVWPVFANLPEQGIKEQEIFWPRSAAESVDFSPTRVFGFQARYNECRIRNSYVTGQMRVYDNSDYDNNGTGGNAKYGVQKPAVLNGVIPASLSYWNFARYFNKRPIKSRLSIYPPTDTLDSPKICSPAVQRGLLY